MIVQLIGEKGGVEKGRVANIINIVNGGVVLELSSAGVPDDKSDDTILIGPPFNLKINLGGWRLPIQVCIQLIKTPAVGLFYIRNALDLFVCNVAVLGKAFWRNL